MEAQLEFLKLEYESLRGELEQLSKELRETERYTIIVIAAVWVWLATNTESLPENSGLYFWWLPVLIVVFGFIRFLGVQQSLVKIAGYIAKCIEPEFLGEKGGWENYLLVEPNRNKVRWWVSSYLIWCALFVASIFIAIMMPC